MHLISQYLIDHGLKRSQSELCVEANLSNELQVCDNIDLDTILLDFCSYYQLKFGKQPKIVKRITTNDTTEKPMKTKHEKSKRKDVRQTSEEKPRKEHEKELIMFGEAVAGAVNVSQTIERFPRISFEMELAPELIDLVEVIERFVFSLNFRIRS